MSEITKKVLICDDCGEEATSRFPAGSIIGGHELASARDLCGACLSKRSGAPVERVVIYEREDPSRGGGATGRPFPTQSALVKTDAWCTCPPPSSSAGD